MIRILMPRTISRLHLTAVLLPALGVLLALSAHAGTQQPTDFSGAWRLDDRNSDTTDTLTVAMRNEARQEQQASTASAPASSSSSAAPADNHSGGHHGGGHGGGMGGGGMNGSGQGGGGHGGKHGGSSTDSKPAAGDKDPLASATFPMPPLLGNDSVLLVQQDAKTFQVRLSNGDQITGKLDGQPHQTLNGNAMVRGRVDGNQLAVSIQYADGTQLDQTWALSADGSQLVVTGAWKIPKLEQPVSFKRTYVGLH